MRFLDLKNEAFGLDINDLSLKIVKLKKKRSGFVLDSFNEVNIAPGIIEEGVVMDEGALVRVIKHACATVKGKKINTKYVVASLPEEKSFLQVIQMPKMNDEELKLAVPFEAENFIPLPIEEVYLDYQVIPSIKDYFDHLEVLIVATPKKIVDSYVSCIKKAGLIPVVLEAESEAITRALVKKEAKRPPLILIDLGENNTDFVVFSGNSTRFTCSIPISSKSFTEAIAESLKVDFEKAEKLKMEYGLIGKKNNIIAHRVSNIVTPILEDLVKQIKKYIGFYSDHSSYEYFLPDGKIGKILLCGGGAELKGLADFLTKRLDILVELGDPFANLAPKRQESIIKKDKISFTTAVGLALREIDNN